MSKKGKGKIGRNQFITMPKTFFRKAEEESKKLFGYSKITLNEKGELIAVP